MQMMYEIIAKELKSAQLENAHPTDYLTFYCLGNREEHAEEPNGNVVIISHLMSSVGINNAKIILIL